MASDLLDVIVNVAISAVRGINGASVAVLIGNRPWFETTNATSAKVRTVDEMQYERAEGPCVEAILMGQEVNISVTTERWPHFSNEAVLAGMRSVCSLPLIFAERTTGALNLYSTVGQPWGSNTARTARKLGGQAGHAASPRGLQRLAISQLLVISSDDVYRNDGGAMRARCFERVGMVVGRWGSHIELLELQMGPFAAEFLTV